jgi:hypothetical protein
MKGDRPAEMKIYKQTFPHTLILAASILAVAFLLQFLI